MNAFWKGLVVSIVIYLFVLTYFAVKLLDYLLWWVSSDRDHLLDTARSTEGVVVLGLASGVLVVFNLAMLFFSGRPAQDG
jgi:hypothetical protein